ncbi:HEAT repeat domain-containing protein [Chryseosolibacter indicus]|uniref:HEAT repeat domain-containing protein n=1 Tax=Chryseosolibacter indicus TaxID=2782351 RepID=A0ABS5VVY0_9BACT|nr:HEAT repeat domain-containing protein [Chryseosolibacter indicus]MBT1705588.1 HEAT repeat domain-containing protein [Chryseosolibacter indicus]
MKRSLLYIKVKARTFNRLLFILICSSFLVISCDKKEEVDLRIKQMDPTRTAEMAKSIEATVTPQLAEGLILKLWGVDSLVADPVSLDIDDEGRLYYTRTNRQKNSEFDIRSHQDWEIESISLQTIDDKRAFLRKTLSPENSAKNEWLADLNKDGSHDWKDMTIQKEHVYRLEDTSGDGIADLSQLMVDDFNDEETDVAGAILKHGDDLFIGVGPDLWRLKDKNGDGIMDEKNSISHGYGVHIGFGGHGMSGLEVGPEGKIYWQIGDIGFTGIDKSGQKWEHPNSGVIVRSNPDGSDFEVFAYGNRNTHEFVFDEYGNLISEDNDGDHPGERERLVYVVNGGDIGWRTNWQFGKYRDPDNNTYKVWMDEKMYLPRFEGQAAHIIPTLANFISGPTGMLYNPGTALNDEYKNTFFVGEFVGNPSKSGIHAFKLKPKGAGFELGDSKMILSGVLATGVDWGPDCAMYMSDWIQGWDTKEFGRIWKLDVAAGQDSEVRKQTKVLLAANFNDYKAEQLSDLLKHADMRVRQKAQFELATREDEGLEVLKQNINQKEHQLARVHGILGISQFARKNIKHAALLLPLLKDNDPEIRAQACKWIGDVRYKEAGNALIPLLKDNYARARFFAAEALGRITHDSAIQPIIQMLRENNDEDVYLRHAGSLALARIGKADPIIALAQDQSRALRIAAVVALRRLKHPEISVFLKDQDEFIVTETARAINDDLSIPEALPALGNVLQDKRFSNEPLIRRAINANLRVGNDAAMQNLIDYSLREGVPTAMRVEAIDALSTWAKPSVVDRVDGRYRGVVRRDLKHVQTKSTQSLIQLTANTNASIRLHAVTALGKLLVAEASSDLVSRLKSDSAPEVRIASLRALANLPGNKMDGAIKQALADKDKRVRIVGLELLSKMDIPESLAVSLLADAINTKTTEEKQAALLTLGNIPVQHSQKVFDQLLTKLEEGQLPAEIQLDLSEAIDLTKSAELKTRFKQATSKASNSADSLKVNYAGALMGGNPERGRSIFFRHQTAQCMRCHSFDDFGGNAGPRLNGVAARLTREQILEALVNPSARIAPGFGIVRLELKDGRSVNGILQEERTKEYVLKSGDKPDTVINKTDVVNRTNSASSMPPMNMLLTKKEIRDLVSFLSTLKGED